MGRLPKRGQFTGKTDPSVLSTKMWIQADTDQIPSPRVAATFDDVPKWPVPFLQVSRGPVDMMDVTPVTGYVI